MKNILGTYFVIAEYPSEAEDKLLSMFNGAGIGIKSERKVNVIRILASEIVDEFDVDDSRLIMKFYKD